MKKLVLLVCIHFVTVWVGYGQSKPQTVMLILGSHEAEIIKSRIQVALKLYKTEKIDKIIVSGGCGAHASGLCEASEMKRQLMESGVPAPIIYKEENSKSTAQNYVFSRALKDENGETVIRKNDSLFVVSDHWHAIAVAARFKKYDGVNARFFIEGEIAPKASDPLDYVGIFNKIPDNVDFILKSTWPTPSAVYNEGETRNYIFEDRVYIAGTGDTLVKSLKSRFPGLPAGWDSSIDAVARDVKKRQSLWFRGGEALILSDAGQQTNKSSVMRLDQLINGLPAWLKYVDAAFIRESELYLFAKDKLFIASRSGKGYRLAKTENLKDRVPDLPYNWGAGDIAAADYDERSQTVFLYKNREVLKFNLKQKAAASREKLNLRWQDLNR